MVVGLHLDGLHFLVMLFYFEDLIVFGSIDREIKTIESSKEKELTGKAKTQTKGHSR